MAEIVLFHHVQGLTDGVRAFAAELGKGGHTVHTPDLLDGQRPASIEEGIALVDRIGNDEMDERAGKVVASLRRDLVYAGFSFGGSQAQRLAQRRPGARGALLYESFVSLSAPWAFGPWPDGLPVQVHGMEGDPYFAGEGDLAGALALAEAVGPELAQVFVYPGDGHLFTDSSLPAYDAEATALVLHRSIEFLDRLA